MAKRTRKEQIDNMTAEEYHRNRNMLRLLVRTRENFVDMVTATGNRLGVKAGGEKQNIKERKTIEEDRCVLAAIREASQSQANEIEKNLKTVLRRFPFYNKWLESVKGVGPNHAAWIIGEIDIRICDTVSKMWQYSGLNPGMVLGKKSVLKTKYKPEMGEIIGTFPPTKNGEDRLKVLTSTLIRGDQTVPGFLSPFNKNLRTALVGRLATSFVRSRVPTYYRVTFFDPYKVRLENSDRLVAHRVKGETQHIPWKDVSKGHRDFAARRYMVKMFLRDVYVHWREVEGLPVREPYAEEYLGKKHFVATEAYSNESKYV